MDGSPDKTGNNLALFVPPLPPLPTSLATPAKIGAKKGQGQAAAPILQSLGALETSESFKSPENASKSTHVPSSSSTIVGRIAQGQKIAAETTKPKRTTRAANIMLDIIKTTEEEQPVRFRDIHSEL